MKHFSKALICILPTLLADSGSPAQAEDSAWHERVDFAGDFRLRYESISAEPDPDRERGRFRGRFGLTAEVASDIDFILRLATGNGSPVSTNQSFDDGFSAKDINVDRAFISWAISDVWRVHGGKIKSPWFRSGGNALLWDSDLNPEGVASSFAIGRYFGSLAVLSVEERSADSDSLLLTAQGGVNFALHADDSLRLGLGLYEFTDTAGNAPFFDGRARGNSIDAAGNYLFGFSLVELFAEWRTQAGRWPLNLFGEWIQNTDAGSEDTAYVIGAKLGLAEKPGSFEVAWSWQDTQADALVATFNDSDFAGGETDSRGNVLEGAYVLRENIALAATVILAKRAEFAGNERDYDRIMLDIEFNFE